MPQRTTPTGPSTAPTPRGRYSYQRQTPEDYISRMKSIEDQMDATPDQPEETWGHWATHTAVPAAIRTVPSVAGSILGGAFGAVGGSVVPGAGTVAGGAGGAIGGGAIGSGLGEAGAQAYERWMGDREEYSPGEMALSTGLGAFGGGLTGGASKSLIKRALVHGGQGAGLSGAQTIGSSLIQRQELPEASDVGRSMFGGFVLGGATGAAFGRRSAGSVVEPPPTTAIGPLRNPNYRPPWNRPPRVTVTAPGPIPGPRAQPIPPDMPPGGVGPVAPTPPRGPAGLGPRVTPQIEAPSGPPGLPRGKSPYASMDEQELKGLVLFGDEDAWGELQKRGSVRAAGPSTPERGPIPLGRSSLEPYPSSPWTPPQKTPKGGVVETPAARADPRLPEESIDELVEKLRISLLKDKQRKLGASTDVAPIGPEESSLALAPVEPITTPRPAGRGRSLGARQPIAPVKPTKPAPGAGMVARGTARGVAPRAEVLPPEMSDMELDFSGPKSQAEIDFLNGVVPQKGQVQKIDPVQTTWESKFRQAMGEDTPDVEIPPYESNLPDIPMPKEPYRIGGPGSKTEVVTPRRAIEPTNSIKKGEAVKVRDDETGQTYWIDNVTDDAEIMSLNSKLSSGELEIVERAGGLDAPSVGRGSTEPSRFGGRRSTIAPGEEVGRVAPLAPTKNKYQEIANRDNVIMQGVRPERGVPIEHPEGMGGFQEHARGGETWITHPWLAEPAGPFKDADETFDFVMRMQDSPEFQKRLKKYNAETPPPRSGTDEFGEVLDQPLMPDEVKGPPRRIPYTRPNLEEVAPIGGDVEPPPTAPQGLGARARRRALKLVKDERGMADLTGKKGIPDVDDVDFGSRPNEMKTGYYDDSGAKVTLHDGVEMGYKGKVKIVSNIEVPVEQRGKGIGRKMLANLLREADETGTTLVGEVQTGDQLGLDANQLYTWYEKNGFRDKGGVLVRKPVRVAQANVEPIGGKETIGDVPPIDEPPTKPGLGSKKKKSLKEKLADKGVTFGGKGSTEKGTTLGSGFGGIDFEKIIEGAEKVRDKAGKSIDSKAFRKAKRKAIWKAQDAGEWVGERLGETRTYKAGLDISAMLRQAGHFKGRAAYWRSLPPAFRTLWSEEGAETAKRNLEFRPGFAAAKKAGIYISDETKLEESVISKAAEKGFFKEGSEAEKRYQGTVGAAYKRTNAFHSGLLNELRVRAFEDMTKNAKPHEIEGLVNYINSATGRGKLQVNNPITGKSHDFEGAANLLNKTFFSARFAKSRLDLLNPKLYTNTNNMRLTINAWRDLATNVGYVAAANAVASAAGADVTIDPRSPDFGKIKIGKSRIDMSNGMQPYIRLLSQIVSKSKVSSVTGEEVKLNTDKFGAPDLLETIERFGEGKLAPVPAFVTNLLRGKQITGEELDYTTPNPLKNEFARLFSPMIVDDMYDLATTDPKAFILFAPLAVAGDSLQTYGEQKAQKSTGGGFGKPPTSRKKKTGF